MRPFSVALYLLYSSGVIAQTQVGTITGTITDPDGHAVANASVQAKNNRTAEMYKASSSRSGNYTLDKLPAGTYVLTVPADGFSLSQFERSDVQIKPAQSWRLDIRLAWGGNLGTPGDDQSVFNLPRSKIQPGAAPRTRDGKPDLSGVWIGALDPDPKAPLLLPWAEAVTRERIANQTKDHPGLFCLPEFPFPGGPLIYKIVQTPELLMTIFENVPNYRQVYLDGRAHPKDPNPSWLGHSIGIWQGDTLVIDTVGFNDKSWIEIFPHTEMLHVIERYRRPNRATMEVEAIIEDSGAYSKPWKRRSTWYLSPKDEVLEYVCAENNKDAPHMVGK